MAESSSYQQFFAELKRRRVFRIAAVYGGGERDACGFRQIWDPWLGKRSQLSAT
jgi:hypothetical protein